jgi:hypothetical protein
MVQMQMQMQMSYHTNRGDESFLQMRPEIEAGAMKTA